MNSRKKFVKQVASTISKNHNKTANASFIFGISGRWGEGKTTFLDDLKKELKSFSVVEINPWKFASDKTSFLRYFLFTLSRERSLIGTAFDNMRGKDRIEDLYQDSTKYKVYWGRLLLYILFVIATGIGYFRFVPEGIRNEIGTYMVVIAALLTPVLVGLIGNIISTQRGSKAISTTDEFDGLLSEILDNVNKKIVVYVDDLDRVTPEIARIVLDNLRTFFDRGDLTFIVTGDHTVLERYIGEQTLPNKDEPEQLEEGRRFLKKIFNVYWRLPLPIQKEFEQFLEGEYKDREADLKTVFTTADEKQKFLTYLAKYFEMNFRQVIRFLDTVVFTFQIINAQLESATDDTKKYFEDLKKKPLLVVRILMIQELCPPLFERILNNPSMLSDLELAVERKDTSKVTTTLGDKSLKLSPTQDTFIRKFVYEEPRFFRNRMWEVYSIEPFLHLAADASFGDQRGPSSEDFIELLKTGDPEQVKSSLANSGLYKMQLAAQATLEFIQGVPQIPEKTAHFKTILTALRDLPAHISQDPFIEKFKGFDLTPYAAETSPVRIPAYTLFWDWLNTQNKSEEDNGYIEMFPYQADEDMNQFTSVSKGNFTSRVVTSWLWNYYSRNERDALEKMRNIFPNLVPEVVKRYMTPHSDALISSLVTDTASDIKENRYFVLVQFTEDGSKKLKKVVLDSVKNLHEEIGQWALVKADEGDAWNKDLWTREEIKQEIHNTLQDTQDIIKVLTYAKDKIPTDTDEIWDIILNRQSEAFIAAFPSMYGVGVFADYVPPQKYAKQLFKKVVLHITKLDDAEKVNWLTYLIRSMWMWLNLEEMPEKKQIEAWTKSENEALKNAATTVFDSWNPKETPA